MSRLQRLQEDEKVQGKAMRLPRYFVLTRIISHCLVLSFSAGTCEIDRSSGSQLSELCVYSFRRNVLDNFFQNAKHPASNAHNNRLLIVVCEFSSDCPIVPFQPDR